MISFLYQLSALRVAEPGQVAAFIFAWLADVVKIEGAGCISLERLQFLPADLLDAGAVRNVAGMGARFLCCGGVHFRRGAGLARFQLLTGQRPADGAVA